LPPTFSSALKGREDARWLEQAIRRACADASGQPLALDEYIKVSLQLAEVLREDLELGESPEPIELGRSHVEGLLLFVLRDQDVQRSAALRVLYDGLVRFRGDAL
jgi:hypothetical protein